METKIVPKEIQDVRADGLLIFAVEGFDDISYAADILPQEVKKSLEDSIKTGILTGKKDEFLTLPLKNGIKRLWLLGLGKSENLEFNTLLNASFRLTNSMRERGLDTLLLWPRVIGTKDLSPKDLITAIKIAAFRFQGLKSEETKGEIETLLFPAVLGKKKTEEIVKKADVEAWAVNWVREVGDLPANLLTPSNLAHLVCEEAKKLDLRIRVYGEAHAQSLGMGSFLGVAKGSDEEAQFIVVEYTPQGNPPEIVFVGKAITFDSGGISLKPSQGMESMKYDMLGGAVALATVFAATKLKLPTPIAAVVPAAENLPGGKALKPGDVLTAMNGKTIEIISTDAEGRLILADALAYACRRYRPRAIIDLATLTGAKVVALGTKVAGLFSNNQKLKEEIKRSSEETHEHVWELPLFKSYFENLRSEVADIKNSGGRPAGAINAALFLSKFVDDTPWAHLDIAGNGARSKKEGAIPPGATGFGVRLLLNLLQRGVV